MDHKLVTKRELMIAEADSFWTKRFVENVSLPLGHDITIISPKNTLFSGFYESCGVRVILNSNTKSLFDKIPKIRGIYRNIRLRRIIEKQNYDFLHVFYASQSSLKAVNLVKNSHDVYVTYWGSDLLRASATQINIGKSVLSKTKQIVVMTEDMKKCFKDKYGNEYVDKVSIIDMGISAFDSIDQYRSRKNECKKFYSNESEEKFFITIAYNADVNQQHIKIIDALTLLPQEIKKRCFMILPMTYRRLDKQYILDVKQKAKESGIKHIVLEDFMNDDEIARMCVASDMFINAQTTDALSASMLEHLYSNSIIVNGTWLKYSFLENNNINCIKFEEFSEIKDIVENVLINKECMDLNDEKVKKILYQECSWETCRKKWHKLLTVD